MTLTSDTILSEMACWPGDCEFLYPHEELARTKGPDGCYSTQHWGGPQFDCIGWVQRDEPGRATEVLARFRNQGRDRSGQGVWGLVEVTPFVRAAVARKRGYVGPVFI